MRSCRASCSPWYARFTAHAAAADDNPALAFLRELQRAAPPTEDSGPYAASAPPPPLPSPAGTLSPSDSTPRRWTHLSLDDGLELQIRDDDRRPRSPAERERLVREILDALAALKK